MNKLFLIEDGFRLDLTDVVDRCIWEAIQYSDIIAKIEVKEMRMVI